MKPLSFFARLEKRIRHKLSHHPVLYALLGGIGVVLFWRGVWHTADALGMIYLAWRSSPLMPDLVPLGDGLISLAAGALLLLSTGLFVSDFIGAEVIATELKEDERRTGSEMKAEEKSIAEMAKELKQATDHLDSHLESMEKKMK